MITFSHINWTRCTEQEVLNRATKDLEHFEERFGKGTMTLQACVDGIIDAEIEWAQG